MERLFAALLNAGKIRLVVSAEAQFAGDDLFGEIAFADEIGNNVNVLDRVRVEKKHRVAQARLFLPERRLHIAKNISPANLGGVRQGRRARVRVHRRPMANDEKPASGIGNHVERSTSKVYFSNG